MIVRDVNRVTPRDVARVFFRHWGKMALFFCGVVGLTLLAIALSPRSYSSESKLMIRVGRESVALDPTATTGETIMLQKTQVDEVNAALDILGSREVLQRVVAQVGAERILNDMSPQQLASADPNSPISAIRRTVAQGESWLRNAMENLRLSDPGTDTDLAVRRLESNVRVWAPKQSTVITVTYSAASPELARDVVRSITDIFLEHHLLLSRTEGSFEFFAEQEAALRVELEAKQAELRDRKNEFQLASTESGRAILEQQIGSVELEILQAQRDLAFSDASITKLQSAIADLDPELVTNRVAGFPNEAKDGMREKLYDLELRESELKSRYTEEYPLLMEVQKQRREAEAILSALPDQRVQTTEALNLNQRKLELALTQAQANYKAIQARLQTAEAQHVSLIVDLRDLNDQELQLVQLQRRVELLDGKYRMHVEKMEQARLIEAMGRERISNVRLAQPATLVSKPIWPNKPLILGIGLIIATGGALGLAFIAESCDQTLRTTSQVEAALGVPVLLSLPYRRRRRSTNASRRSVRSETANAHGRASAKHEHLGNYRSLVRELLSANELPDLGTKTLGVIACDASHVRSRVATDLAIQSACLGREPVLLIDGDARRRRIAKRFGVNQAPGWRDVMIGSVDAEGCIHQRHPENLAVMSPGGGNGQATALQPSIGVLGQLDDLKTSYGLIVVDMPPAQELDGPITSREWLDEVILVVDAERTRIQVARHLMQDLKRAGVQLKGIVLANRRDHIPRWIYRRL